MKRKELSLEIFGVSIFWTWVCGMKEEKESRKFHVFYLGSWVQGAAIYRDLGYGRYDG